MAIGPKFFPSEPREGEPIARRGIAKGLRLIERALRYLSIDGGYIDWHGNEPKIVIEFPPVPETALPTGGLKYQVLSKQSTADGDADWDWARWP